MPIKHVTKQIEAYLDHQLSREERRRLEDHLATCPSCAYRLFEARRLTHELGPMMKKALGQPGLSPALRDRVRQALEKERKSGRFSFPWAASGRVLNAVGTVAVVTVLAFGVYAVIRGQLAPISPQLEINRAQANLGSRTAETLVPELSSPVTTLLPKATPQPAPSVNSLKDTLSLSPSHVDDENEDLVERPADDKMVEERTAQDETTALRPAPKPAAELTLPHGTIAFPLFNPTTQTYEVYLIHPDGSNLHRYPLAGVSEPALRQTDSAAYQIAYRAWADPTAPRSLVSNNLSGDQPDSVTHFWEDAHPDWSPTENRLIFASQRESDRRWRLYTVWGDGSAEKNLRREGKSPTFAPDGFRFAFESCRTFPNQDQCGLWITDLNNSQHEATLFLADPLAKAPDWSPVGEEIVYMANRDGNWDLYVTGSDGQTIRRLTDSLAIDGLPVWSPDGQWLAFLSDREGQWGLWLLHLESGQSHPLFTFEAGHFNPPNRPPYGERRWWDEQLSWSE